MHLRQTIIKQFKTITAACRAGLVCAEIFRSRDSNAGLNGAHGLNHWNAAPRRRNPFGGIAVPAFGLSETSRVNPTHHDDRRRHNEQRRDAELVEAFDRAMQAPVTSH